jgi:hypothetical protein
VLLSSCSFQLQVCYLSLSLLSSLSRSLRMYRTF